MHIAHCWPNENEGTVTVYQLVIKCYIKDVFIRCILEVLKSGEMLFWMCMWVHVCRCVCMHLGWYLYVHGEARSWQHVFSRTFWASFTEVEPFIESGVHQLNKSSYSACPWTPPNLLHWDCRHTTTPFWFSCGWRWSKLHHSQCCAVSVLFILLGPWEILLINYHLNSWLWFLKGRVHLDEETLSIVTKSQQYSICTKLFNVHLLIKNVRVIFICKILCI